MPESIAESSEYSRERRIKIRRKRRAQPVCPSEKFILLCLTLQITFATWAFGLRDEWAQWTLFWSAIVIFSFIFLPRPDEALWARIKAVTLKAVKSPVCWFISLFLGYILIQALNPAYVYQFEDLSPTRRRWWLEPLTPRWSELPKGVDTPFEIMNAWRDLMLKTTVALIALTLYFGVDRRRSITFVLWVIFLNGFALAVFAVVSKAMEMEMIFGFYEGPNNNFFGTFVYRNFGAAFLYLTMAAGMALFFIYRRRSLAALQKSGPHFGILLLILFVLGSIGYSLSRGGTTWAVAIFMAFLSLWIFSSFLRSTGRDRIFLLSGFVLLVIACLGVVTILPYREEFEERFSGLFEEEIDGSREARQLAGKVMREAINDNPTFGWGAGSFRHVFALYAAQHPEVSQPGGPRRARAFWRHGHNDWYEFQFEYGQVGSGLALGCALAWIFPFLYRIRFLTSASLILAVGFGGLMMHAISEFVLQNLSILTVGTLLLAIGARKVEIDSIIARPNH